ncbi:4001_t:CDS:1, partial [Racocetra fulgida]
NQNENYCDCDETIFSGDCEMLFLYPLWEVKILPARYQKLIHVYDEEDDDLIDRYNIKAFISISLKHWAIENIDTHGISQFAKAIKNATLNLCDVIEFLKDERTQREITKMKTAF